jgi:hypothetical protein
MRGIRRAAGLPVPHAEVDEGIGDQSPDAPQCQQMFPEPLATHDFGGVRQASSTRDPWEAWLIAA